MDYDDVFKNYFRINLLPEIQYTNCTADICFCLGISEITMQKKRPAFWRATISTQCNGQQSEQLINNLKPVVALPAGCGRSTSVITSRNEPR